MNSNRKSIKNNKNNPIKSGIKTIITKKQRKQERTRELIVNAAEKLFEQTGFEHTTMDQIAEEAILSKTTIYSYFDRKEDIFIALAIRAYEKLNSLFTHENISQMNAMDRMLKIGRAFYNFCLTFPLYRQALDYSGRKYIGTEMNFLEQSKTRIEFKRLREQENNFVKIWIQIIQTAIDQGIICTKYPPPMMAIGLGSLITGFIDELSKRADTLTLLNIQPEQIFEMVLDFLRFGMEKRS